MTVREPRAGAGAGTGARAVTKFFRPYFFAAFDTPAQQSMIKQPEPEPEAEAQAERR